MWHEDHCSTTISCGSKHAHIAFSLIILKAYILKGKKVPKIKCLTYSHITTLGRNIFRGARTAVKSDYYLCHVHPSVRPSVRPHVSERLLQNGFPWNLILATFNKNPNLIKTGGKKIFGTRHDDQRSQGFVFLPATPNRHKSALFDLNDNMLLGHPSVCLTVRPSSSIGATPTRRI